MTPSADRTRVAADEKSLTYCVLAYHFPPDTSAGAMRAHGLARELADLGNEVHVFTAASGPDRPEGYTVHVVPGHQAGDGVKAALGLAPRTSLHSGLRGLSSRVVRRVARDTREWVLFPDGYRAWSRRCAAAVASWLATNSCDVLISTAPPWSTHMAAKEALGSKAGPGPIWIEDCRDLLVANPHYRFGRVRRWRDRRLEGGLLARADAVTVTTREMGRILSEAYPRVRIVPVYNGYDERALAPERRRSPEDARLTFTHAGNLYEGRRSALPLLRSVASLISTGDIDRSRVCLQFAGPPDATLRDAVEELGLADVVRLRGIVPRSDVPKMLEQSDVLLVIMWDPVREASLIPAKTFEYVAARRLILALNCSPSSELGQFLTRTRTGICVEGEEGIGAAVGQCTRASCPKARRYRTPTARPWRSTLTRVWLSGSTHWQRRCSPMRPRMHSLRLGHAWSPAEDRWDEPNEIRDMDSGRCCIADRGWRRTGL